MGALRRSDRCSTLKGETMKCEQCGLLVKPANSEEVYCYHSITCGCGDCILFCWREYLSNGRECATPFDWKTHSAKLADRLVESERERDAALTFIQAALSLINDEQFATFEEHAERVAALDVPYKWGPKFNVLVEKLARKINYDR